MKIYKAIAIALAAILLTVSCGVLGGRSSKAARGRSIGESLLAIYTQYKTDGKIDLSNLENIINLANIAGKLKGHSFDEADNSEFISGLISGADNVINESNAAAVAGMLGRLSQIDMSALTEAAKAAGRNAAGDAARTAAATLASSSEVSAAVATISGILNLMRR